MGESSGCWDDCLECERREAEKWREPKAFEPFIVPEGYKMEHQDIGEPGGPRIIKTRMVPMADYSGGPSYQDYVAQRKRDQDEAYETYKDNITVSEMKDYLVRNSRNIELAGCATLEKIRDGEADPWGDVRSDEEKSFGENLIFNAGFEEGTSGWEATTWGETEEVNVVNSMEVDHVYEVTVTVRAQNPVHALSLAHDFSDVRIRKV